MCAMAKLLVDFLVLTKRGLLQRRGCGAVATAICIDSMASSQELGMISQNVLFPCARN